MEQSQINYEPWKIVRELGHGSFGTVYEISREEFGETYKAALKVITIPQSESDIVANRADGMDDMSITAYYNSVVQELTHEFALLSKLKGHTNIVSYEDHKVVPHENGIGWDIFIRMELLTSLTSIAASRDFSRNEVIRLGRDICSALILCEQKNIIHRDIKPDNIFISETGDFELGDFGIARTATRTMSNMSRKGTPNYMAPEVYMNRPYNHTADIYSLGIVLYQLMNRKRLPFIPAQLTVANREEALGLRMSGHRLPMPEEADSRLAAIILKACAFAPEERYASAQLMKKDLDKLLMEEETAQMNNQSDATQFEPQNGQFAQQAGQYQNNPYAGQQAGQFQNNQYMSQQTGQYQNNPYAGQQTGQYQNNQYMGQQTGQFQNNPYAGQQTGQYQNNQYMGQRTGQYQNNQYTQPQNGQFAGNQTMGNFGADQTMNNQTWTGATQVQPGGFGGVNNQMPSGNGMPDPGVVNTGAAGSSGGDTPKKKGNKKMIIGIAAGAGVLLLGLLLVLTLGKGKDEEPAMAETPKTEETAAAAVAEESAEAEAPSEEEAPAEEVPAEEEAPAEEVPAEETSAEAPDGLSDNLSDYMFELEGYLYQLPVAYADFKETGWEIDPTRNGTEEDELPAGEYEYYYLTNGISTIQCTIFNASGNVKQVKDCNIGSITVYAKDNLDFCIAKGIEPSATAEEIKEAFGTPNSSNTYDTTETLRYESDPDNYNNAYTRFSCDSLKAANNYIELKYYVATESDITEVSAEAPEYLASYAAPEELGDDPTQPVFELMGDLYRLPCPVSVFLDNGWEITAMDEQALGGQAYGSGMKLTKGSVSVWPMVMNFDKNAQMMENCAVTDVSIGSYDIKDESPDCFVLAGGLTLESTAEDAAATGFSSDTSGNNTYYTYEEGEVSIRLTYFEEGASFKIANQEWDY